MAYLLMLAVLSATAAVVAHALHTGSSLARRDAESALLVMGQDFEAALASHGGRPRNLQDLLRDPRFPGTKRHLRRIPLDPLTGKPDWGLMCDNQGGIVSVFSRSRGQPVRQAGFSAPWTRFNGARTYRNWAFGAPPDPTQTECAASGDAALAQ
ncbi:type II secretion system protein [Hydrogenophaga sp. XSHU_21]